ncbi:hypothetical protein PT015_00335 [Candidatus Mycobacterium wuenschmannii]|uniref:Uncharacterized protein n=1 Tax=Candidatus Mycobacterium wuenschmannii TaxID=3027808 RepID=A0ABY8VWL0_9MYCO|nr:hypothetical protein [Candidatus Mycobacterium wuenschmannii]WIM88020.1 hypothetical protein PT015_00335 [Candidatus Mycobacterium wuenschmannii]
MAIPLQSIETVDELAALPLKSMVREMFRRRSAAADNGSVWERRRSGWHQISGIESSPPVDQPALPVRLLWHPKWREILP